MTTVSTTKTVSVTSESLSDIAKAASELLTFSAEIKVITLTGNLGAGKTTFIKAICAQLGVTDLVSSPTFSIINEYRDRENTPVYHFDFYRIKTTQEAEDTGCMDYFFSGNYCFIEWPQITESLLPDEYVSVEITIDGNENRIIKMTLSSKL